MQDLKQRWEIGSIYHFKHGKGYWEGDVQIVDYRKAAKYGEDFDDPEALYDAVIVTFVSPKPSCFKEYEKEVPLNAEYRWGFDKLDLNLENK